MAGFDPVELYNLREARRSEAANRIANLLGARRTGRRSLDDDTDAELDRQGAIEHEVSSQMASDPYTGDAERARVADTRTKLNDAAMTMRPEIADATEQVSRRNAFADFLKKRAGYQGEVSPEGTAALDATSRRKIAENEALAGAHETPSIVQGLNGPQLVDKRTGMASPIYDQGGMPVGTKLPEQADRALTSMREGAPLVGELEQIIGSGKGNVGSAIANRLAYGLYRHLGVSPDTLLGWMPSIGPSTQKRLQVAGLLKVLGAAPYAAGSRNFQFLKQAQEHLTDPGASDEFLLSQIQEIKKLWPRLQQELLTAHTNPSAALNFTPAGGDMTDPNRGR